MSTAYSSKGGQVYPPRNDNQYPHPSSAYSSRSHRPPPPPGRSGSASASGIPSSQASQFKPMYDLPSSVTRNGATTPDSSKTLEGGGGRVRATAGGLARLNVVSPPPGSSIPATKFSTNPSNRPSPSHAHSNINGPTSFPSSSSLAAVASSTVTPSPPVLPPRTHTTTSSSSSSTGHLFQPQPRKANQSPAFGNTTHESQSPPRSPSAGSTFNPKPPSVFSVSGQNPSSPSPADLSHFTSLCQSFYYDNPQLQVQAQVQIEAVLKTLPPHHRATFTRIQAAVRAQFHQDETLRRKNEFEILLRGTVEGGALTVQNRANPTGEDAQKERLEKFKIFLTNQAGKGNVGPEPFFRSLYGILKLQAMEETKGGAGHCRVEWEIDDAVWMEAGGKDFMVEAVAVVKGVLGFSDTPRKIRSKRPKQQSPLVPPRPAGFRHQHRDSEELQSTPEESEIEELANGRSHTDRGPLYERLNSFANGDHVERPNFGSRKAKASPPPLPSSQRSPRHQNSKSQHMIPMSDSNSSLGSPVTGNSQNRPWMNRTRSSSDPFSDPRGLGLGNPFPSSPDSQMSLPGPRTFSGRGPAPPPPTGNRRRPNLNVEVSTIGSTLSGASSDPQTPGVDDMLLPGGVLVRGYSSDNGAVVGGTVSEAENDGDESEDEDDNADSSKPRPRVWLAPSYLSNPEIHSLLSAFPTHIANATVFKKIRFPYRPPAQRVDLEAGAKVPQAGVLDNIGTGKVWRGEKAREGNWRGSGWQRFMMWLKRLFGG